MSRFLTIVLVLCVLPGCGKPEKHETRSAGPLGPLAEDPQLVAVDHALPFTRFDGASSSILAGEAWQQPVFEGDPRAAGTKSFSWVLGRQASLWVERAAPWPVDLRGRCRALTRDDLPAQTVDLVIDGREIGRQTLSEHWQDLRFAIPDGALAPGLNELVLRMAYARQPRQVLPGSEDPRRLSIACRWLALSPRDLDDPPRAAGAARYDGARRELILAVGTHASFPLPPASQVTARLEAVHSSCRSCFLHAELVTATGTDSLWRSPVQDAGGTVLSLSTERGAVSRLRLGLEAAGGEVFDRRRQARIELAPGFPAIRTADQRLDRPHVFLYLIDTLRADALGPFGGDPELSPRITELARDAVVYRNAWSASSWTLPSMVSILTGTYPFRHGVMQGRSRFTGEGTPSVAALLSDAGYTALGISQSYVASNRFGIDSGFERFFLNSQLNSRQLRSHEIRRDLLRDLSRPGVLDRPLFAYLHTVAPHAPYTPREPDRRFADRHPAGLPPEKYAPLVFMDENLGEDPGAVAHLRGLYDGEVAYADRQLGRFVALLRYLGLYDSSLIIFLSDHGEEFGEHGGFSHGRTLYEEMLRVPLIVKYPDSRWAGTEISQRVSTVDVVPTILELAGVTPEKLAFDGSSLAPPALEERPRARRVTFAEVRPATAGNLQAVDYQAIALGDLKCIHSLAPTDQFGRPVPQWQIFDLASDPSEGTPLLATSEEAARCRRLLEAWLASREDSGPVELPAASEEALEQLRALGYID